MSEKRRLAINTLLIGASNISSKAISLLMLPFYTAVLSTSEYGTTDLIITYASLFVPLIALNMETAMFRHLVDARSNNELKNKIITNALEVVVLSLAVAGIIFCFANTFLQIPMAASIAFYFFSISFGNIILQVARGLGDTKAFAATGIAQGVLGAILSLVFLYIFNMGPQGILFGLGIGIFLPAVLLSIVLKMFNNIKLSARDTATKKELLRYSLPLVPNSISWWVYNASDRTIITAIIGPAANGIYAVTNKFSGVLNALWSVFYMSWSESAAININKPGRDRFFSEIANMTIKAFGSIAMFGTMLTQIAFPLFASAEYNEALLYVPILMFAGILNIITGFYNSVYIAKKMTKQVMITSMIAAGINIIVNLALISFIGIWAAAISTAVAYGVMAINRHYDMKKYVKIKYEKGIFVKVILLFAVVSALYYLNNIWASIAGLVIAIVAGVVLNRGLIKNIIAKAKTFLKSRQKRVNN